MCSTSACALVLAVDRSAVSPQYLPIHLVIIIKKQLIIYTKHTIIAFCAFISAKFCQKVHYCSAGVCSSNYCITKV